MTHPLTHLYFRPQPDMTVQELALAMIAIDHRPMSYAFTKGILMTTRTWDATPPSVRRHFTPEE